MTVTGGFPAPGPRDRNPSHKKSYVGPPPTGPAMPPQIPMLTAHKPGIVPLRPLTFPDILDGAFKAVRFNPKSMVGLSALVLGAFLVPSAALGIGATHLVAGSLRRLGPEAEAFLGIPSMLIQLMTTSLATGLLSGLLIHVVGQAVLGRKPNLAQTWRSARGRLASLLALTFLSGLFGLLSVAVLIGPGVLLLLNDSTAAGVILLSLGFLSLPVVSLAVSAKISMAAPAIVLEGHRVLPGLGRSFALTRGAAFWRVLGITLAAGFIAGIAGALLGLPFSFIGTAIRALAGQDSVTGEMGVTFVSHLSTLLTGAITTPFVAAVTGLLYIDRRMRLEALDVVLLREAQSNPAPRI
jgi:hypothetical protein